MMVIHLTSQDTLDYIVLSDFFLTFRQFLAPSSLLELLMGRLAWAAKSQPAIHGAKRDVVAVRTFVLLRHWVLNFFADDFVPSFALRSSFADALTDLLGWDIVQTTKTQGFGLILAQLETCWARACALYWDDSRVGVGIGPGGVLGFKSLGKPGVRRSVLRLYQNPVQSVLNCEDQESSLVSMTEQLINGGITLSSDVESPLAAQKKRRLERPPAIRALLSSWKKDIGRHKDQTISKLFPKVGNSDSKPHEEHKKVRIDVLSARAMAELETILKEKQETSMEVAPHDSEWECSADSDISLPRRQSFQSSENASIKSGLIDLPNDTITPSQLECTATNQFAVADLGIAPAPKMASQASLDSMPGLHTSRSWSLYSDAFETPTRRKESMKLGPLPFLNVSDQNETYIHTPFVLNYSSKDLAAQLTLVERAALAELDWKELIDLSWRKKGISTSAVHSWLGYVAQTSKTQQGRGVQAVVTRSNLVVAWIQSEILLTRDKPQRIETVTRFIQIAVHARRLQNYATVMQVVLALGAGTIRQLKSTWAGVDPQNTAALDELERLVGPVRNFARLRAELSSLDPALGCVPFLGLYLSDLTFNAERPSFVVADLGHLVNFERFRTSSAVVRALMQCIEWSQNYQLKTDTDLQAKCLYIHTLTELEMKGCRAHLQE